MFLSKMKAQYTCISSRYGIIYSRELFLSFVNYHMKMGLCLDSSRILRREVPLLFSKQIVRNLKEAICSPGDKNLFAQDVRCVNA